jgi:hypothetical protein
MRCLMVEQILHGSNAVQKQAIHLLVDLGGKVPVESVFQGHFLSTNPPPT